jgi:AraC-like DNA-binding protein
VTAASPRFATRKAGAAAHSKGVVRVASLASVPSLLRDMGTDPIRLLKGVGLDPRVFKDPENPIGLVDAGRLLEVCAQSTGCPHFGLLVGQRGGVDSLGMLGALMLHSPTVDAALRSLTLHMHLRTRGGVPTRTVEGRWATLGYAIYQRGMPGSAYAHDVAIAIAFNIMRTLCGVNWLPSEVQFARAKPRDARPYRQFFRSPLRFDADRTAIVFDRRWLDRSLPGCDATLHGLLEKQIAEREALDVEDLAERVRRALRTMLVTGRGAEEHVADLFSIHPRTLHRRLRAQGTSLRGLVEEGRCEIACQLLRDTTMNVSEIANVLDYADATALTRAFGRWMNCPPAAWRAKVCSGEAKSG